MPRFPALTLLVTVFYFFVCATQVSTLSHSDMSLRTINIIPQLYPILTISVPPPTRSPCAGINRCDKTPIYGTWTSRFIRSANQARGYPNVRNTIRPYLLQVGRYVHQVAEMLCRPTPDSSLGLTLMPTTGKAASPLVCLPPPPPPPTRSLPVYPPPTHTPTSGPWNPPTATTGHSRPRHDEPIVEVDSDDWFQQALFIGSTLILAAMSFIWRFMKALSSVKCVEHRNPESDGAVPSCGTIRSIVPPATETTVSKITRKPSVKPKVENQQSRPESPLVTPPASYPEPTRDVHQLLRPDNTLNHISQTHSLLVTTEKRVPLLIERHPTITEERFETQSEEPRHLRPRPVAQHRAPLLIEWYPTWNDVARRSETTSPPSRSDTVSTPSFTLVSYTFMTVIPTYGGALVLLPRPIPSYPFKIASHELLHPVIVQHPCARNSNIHNQGVAIGRRAPPRIGWRSEPCVEVILPLAQAVFEPSSSAFLNSTTEHLYTTPTTRLSYHLLRTLDVPSYAHIAQVPNFNHKIDRPPARLLIKWHPPPQVAQSPDNEAKPDLPPPPPVKVQPLPHIPVSFYRYGNVTLEDLGAYPPEERRQKLHREIRVADAARYQHEKSRRNRARFNNRLMRSEMERKGKRLPKRRKCEEEIEEEMRRVMMARRRGDVAVFKGRGGPPPAVAQCIQDWFDMLARDCGARGGKGMGDGKKGKRVRWADDAGKSLVVE
ncbi:hypothetical protein FRC11_007540 [Ceratobasidium sp. 423]|nr:hypothetical protein FRC11_007540 [Ceratobasidium sp. 423]